MRWTTKWKDPNPYLGDIRIRKGFLFFPKKIDTETRWLEYARWVEELCEVRKPGTPKRPTRYVRAWVPIRWHHP